MEELLPKPEEKELTEADLALERIKELTIEMDNFYTGKNRLSIARLENEPQAWYKERKHWIKKLEHDRKKYGTKE